MNKSDAILDFIYFTFEKSYHYILKYQVPRIKHLSLIKEVLFNSGRLFFNSMSILNLKYKAVDPSAITFILIKL